MWEKELNIIDGLMMLYPVFKDDRGNVMTSKGFFPARNNTKAFWLLCLCIDHLNQRIPSLEEYIRKNNPNSWRWYKEHFGME